MVSFSDSIEGARFDEVGTLLQLALCVVAGALELHLLVEQATKEGKHLIWEGR